METRNRGSSRGKKKGRRGRRACRRRAQLVAVELSPLSSWAIARCHCWVLCQRYCRQEEKEKKPAGEKRRRAAVSRRHCHALLSQLWRPPPFEARERRGADFRHHHRTQSPPVELAVPGGESVSRPCCQGHQRYCYSSNSASFPLAVSAPNSTPNITILLVLEDDPRYWEVMSSALSVGWLDIVLENGLVEAVAVLISKMPRLCHESTNGKLGELFKSKPGFIKNNGINIDHPRNSYNL
ncbi:hypothetical protein Ahy_B06g082768 [Arachis hypogaea]|uniref:Uncharacterized protein n=1 Tax=Arachis hypogaea TaxID=3818 RepID=A0A444YNV7_ARAHY|nr:hypothetical protein Ahy_B06g082768 [Arachis hypogaea]